MLLSEFDYNLPKKYIAQTPTEPRDYSKLLVLDRKTGKIEHKRFYDIGEYLRKGDVLVVNNSKVMAARLFGYKSTGAKVEVLLLHKEDENICSSRIWQVLVKPAKKLKVGDEVVIDGKSGEGNKPHPDHPLKGDGKLMKMKIIKELEEGMRLVEFDNDIIDRLDDIGIVPLPPYIEVDDARVFKERYQTVYSKVIGSSAAPTAGLHFTPELIKNLKKKGIVFENATLHIGLDTFRPMSAENIEEHKIHKEYCELDEKTAFELNKAKEKGNRVIAVGTTATRVLETACRGANIFKPFSGLTDIFIYPGYEFKAIDALITNFHLPKSSLLLMVSAFCGNGGEDGKKLVFKAYEEAKKYNYKFFSFGDAMIII